MTQTINSLQRNGQSLLFKDWQLIGGSFDQREEFLEQFDPPDPYEVDEFVDAIDLADIAYGTVRLCDPPTSISER